MVVAAIGIVINTATAVMFMGGRDHDINVRGAFLHMAGDAAVSAGVVLAAFVIGLTGAWWIDPVVSLAIVALIGWSTWGLARDALRMSLHAVPDGINEARVRAFLVGRKGVSAVHDLHIWPMSTTETALTAHLVMPGGHPGDVFHTLAEDLVPRFRHRPRHDPDRDRRTRPRMRADQRKRGLERNPFDCIGSAALGLVLPRFQATR
jgi:cobalt-zinc-cadmium efflux system protein